MAIDGNNMDHTGMMAAPALVPRFLSGGWGWYHFASKSHHYLGEPQLYNQPRFIHPGVDIIAGREYNVM